MFTALHTHNVFKPIFILTTMQENLIVVIAMILDTVKTTSYTIVKVRSGGFI